MKNTTTPKPCETPSSGSSVQRLVLGAVVLSTRDIPKLIPAGQYVCRKGDRLIIEEDLTSKDCPHDYAVCMEAKPSWKFAVSKHEISSENAKGEVTAACTPKNHQTASTPSPRPPC